MEKKMIGRPKELIITLSCESYPQFNKSWETSGFVMGPHPDFVLEWAEERRKELGLEKLPDDLYIHKNAR